MEDVGRQVGRACEFTQLGFNHVCTYNMYAFTATKNMPAKEQHDAVCTLKWTLLPLSHLSGALGDDGGKRVVRLLGPAGHK